MPLNIDEFVTWDEEKKTATLSSEKLAELRTAIMDEGVGKGLKQAANKLQSELGITLDNPTVSNIAAEIKTKLDVMNDPEQLKKLVKTDELDIVKNLQQANGQLQSQLDKVTSEYSSFKNDAVLNESLAPLAKHAHDPSAWIKLFRSQYNVGLVDGRLAVVDAEGKPTTDNLGRAVEFDAHVQAFNESNSWMLKAQGQGGSGTTKQMPGITGKKWGEMTKDEQTQWCDGKNFDEIQKFMSEG